MPSLRAAVRRARANDRRGLTAGRSSSRDSRDFDEPSRRFAPGRAAACRTPRLRTGRGSHPGRRHRRQRGDLQHRQRAPAATAAVSGFRGDRERGTGAVGQSGTGHPGDQRAAAAVGRGAVVRGARRLLAVRLRVGWPGRPGHAVRNGGDAVPLSAAAGDAAVGPALHGSGGGRGRTPGRAAEPRSLDEAVRIRPGRHRRPDRVGRRTAHRARGAPGRLRILFLRDGGLDAARRAAVRTGNDHRWFPRHHDRVQGGWDGCGTACRRRRRKPRCARSSNGDPSDRGRRASTSRRG